METNLKAIELRDLWRRYKDERDEKARERLVLAARQVAVLAAGQDKAAPIRSIFKSRYSPRQFPAQFIVHEVRDSVWFVDAAAGQGLR